MLIVIVDFTVAPENMGLAQATMEGEAPIVRALPGNLGYSVWVDPDHPGALRLMHEWSDAASFDGYKATPTFKAVGAVLFPMMIGKPSTRRSASLWGRRQAIIAGQCGKMRDQYFDFDPSQSIKAISTPDITKVRCTMISR